jgi:hypothetical protein
VPYWECLSIQPTNPAFRTEVRQWFDSMGAGERDRFAETALVRAGYLPGTGASPRDLSAAVARYQAANDLVPSGRVDFELYYRMLASDSARARPGGGATTVAAAAVAATPVPSSPPPAEAPRPVLATTRGRPVYRVGETMTVSVQPTGDAFLYCYYRDADGEVARIYPNRFQPDAFVPARSPVVVPPPGAAFSIRFDKAGGADAVSCLAADREVGLLLPPELKRQDLEPLPARSLEDIAARFRAIPGVRVNEAKLSIEVTR